MNAQRILILAQQVWLETLRRKDVYVLLILLTGFLAALMSVNAFGLGQMAAYMKETGLLLAWIFSWILAINTSTRQIPREESQGTVYLLLAKPVSRADVVLGKWLGTWSVTVVATVSFYAVLAVVALLRQSPFGLPTLVQALLLHSTLLAILTAIGIWFSTRLNYDAAATLTYVLTLAAWLVLPRVPTFVLNTTGFQQWGLMLCYYALPHFELFDMRRRLVYDAAPILLADLGLILLYGTVIIAFFLILAWLAWRRKRFVRGAAV